MNKITTEHIYSLGEDIDRLIDIFVQLPTLDSVTATELRQERELLRGCLEWLKVRITEELQAPLQEVFLKFQEFSLLVTARSPFSERN